MLQALKLQPNIKNFTFDLIPFTQEKFSHQILFCLYQIQSKSIHEVTLKKYLFIISIVVVYSLRLKIYSKIFLIAKESKFL